MRAAGPKTTEILRTRGEILAGRLVNNRQTLSKSKGYSRNKNTVIVVFYQRNRDIALWLKYSHSLQTAFYGSLAAYQQITFICPCKP
jgi:hypothetical protein